MVIAAFPSIPDQTNAVVAFKSKDAKRETAARQFITYWLSNDYALRVAFESMRALGTESGVLTPSMMETVFCALMKDVSKSGTVATSIPDQTNAVVAFKSKDAKRETAARQFITYLRVAVSARAAMLPNRLVT
jgi:Zn-dependent M28 family amino/carboxypeptidase